MTVGELIEALQEFNPETRVLVNGYELGYDDIAVSELTSIALNVHSEWYYGKHDLPNEASVSQTKSKKIEAVILKRI